MTIPARFAGEKFAAVTLLCVLCLTAAAYWPGLSGGFLFDDYANLPALGRYGGVRDWQSFAWYLTSGIADPTGRPVSMLSFLIDAQDWPADPWPFKRTNLLLHLANGALLYSLLSALGRRALSPSHARWAAVLATAAWLLHPLWASTVLYIIQRHAMLAAFFVLAGIRAWIASRNAFEQGHARAGWCWALLSVPVFGLLAALSKANGVLLPVLILALELSALRPRVAAVDATRSGDVARLVFVWIPSLLVLLALGIAGFNAFDTTQGSRDWSLWQRLLTEPRAMFDYLAHLVIPGLPTRGVFADGFVVSTSAFRPITTLFAGVALIALSAFGFASRHRHPALAAAILFFLAGHLVESTVIPLELYFEHRNYLPACLLFWPLALWLTGPRRYAGILRVGACAAIVAIALLTSMQARLWSDPIALSHRWAAAQPNSARAQSYAASLDLSAGNAAQAAARLAPLAAAHPDEPQYALGLLDARCQIGIVPDEDIARAEDSLRMEGVRNDFVNGWMTALLSPAKTDPCNVMPQASFDRLLSASLEPVSTDIESESRRRYLLGLAALHGGRCDDALARFDERLELQRRPEFASLQIGLLGTYCDQPTALLHLDRFLASDAEFSRASNYALRVREWLMDRDGYWPREWARLRQVLLQDTNRPAAK